MNNFGIVNSRYLATEYRMHVQCKMSLMDRSDEKMKRSTMNTIQIKTTNYSCRSTSIIKSRNPQNHKPHECEHHGDDHDDDDECWNFYSFLQSSTSSHLTSAQNLVTDYRHSTFSLFPMPYTLYISHENDKVQSVHMIYSVVIRFINT